MHGMSVSKFKRILGLILTEFFMQNEFFYLHNVDLNLIDYTEFLKKFTPKIHDYLTENLPKYHRTQEELKNAIG